MAEELRLSIADGTGTITLDRAGHHNAITSSMWAAFPSLIAELSADPAVRLIVIRGANGNFAAGADIAEFDIVYASRTAATQYAALMAGAMEAISACEKPVIAAIEGYCIGGAVAISLCCDLCFADSAAKFAITPARLGLAYAFADTRRLVSRIGAPAARDLLFSARRIDAAEALRINLIDRVFAPGTLETGLMDYLASLAANSPASLKIAKHFIALAMAGQTAETTETRNAYLEILESPDFAEGKSAFKSRRPPKFR
jgi:enoyl-CoA hydratase/carnithine racemase